MLLTRKTINQKTVLDISHLYDSLYVKLNNTYFYNLILIQRIYNLLTLR